MNPFDAAMRSSDLVLLATFGKMVRVVPMITSPRRPSVVDPDREEGVVKAVYQLSGIDGSFGGPGFHGITNLAEADAILWLPKASLDILKFIPRKDDEVYLEEVSDAPAYLISKRYPSDRDDATLHMTRKTEAP